MLALRIDPVEDTPGDVGQYVRRFAEWKAVAKYPELVANVYLLKADRTALRLNSSLRRFEPEQWPIWFEPLRPELRRISEAFLRSRTLQTPHGVFGIDDPAAGWRFEPSIPALFHLVISGDAREKSVDWIAIELSAEQIRTRVLPDLSRTYFQGTDGLDYLVAVISDHEPGGAHREVMYSSDPGFGDPEPTDADGTIDLFGRPQDAPSGSPVRVFHTPADKKGPDPLAKIAWFPFLRGTHEGIDWRLAVRHRRGGALGAFVVEMRRRDRAIGFGVSWCWRSIWRC